MSMIKKTKISSEEKKDAEELPKIFLVEKIFIVLLALIILFDVNDIYIAYYVQSKLGIQITDVLLTPLLAVLVVSIGLLILIMLKFSREIKSKISFVVGIMGILILGLHNLGNFLIDLFWATPIMLVFGLIYGIIGLKSSSRKLAIFGILFNAVGLLLTLPIILFTIAVLRSGFAP